MTRGAWQRAVNRQPGFRSNNSKSRSASFSFSFRFLKFSKNNSKSTKLPSRSIFFMVLSFGNVISSIQIFNTLSKTILETLKTLVDEIIILKNFFMVRSIYVRGPALARLAIVSALLSIGNTPALRVILL